ncbi:hypothetical protein EGT74_19480 [Chitinophaga lutea]|uniref:Uncharacterized protein n=1 Tax=Chitinophaga lutea TaxID=2488634 RepID=A0A3N4PZR4_9BACT|nr:hypothetical protein [Chitinophaga lutea]RPE09190.1 hypothetical protein EGT74_19480 [Chitinophaga lutea]
MKKIWFILYAAGIASCNSGHQAGHPGNPGSREAYFIAPVYNDSVYFSVNARYTDKVVVRGSLGNFSNIDKTLHEVYFQRFVSKSGRFRKIHAVGTSLETIRTGTLDSVRMHQFNQYVEFDELGIFNGAPTDPISLIPLYPGRKVKVHEYWDPAVQVKVGFGEGLAHFRFDIDSVYRGEYGFLFARINVKFDGVLQPAAALKGANVTISGKGWFTWNCTIHQRRDTHLTATYSAVKGNSEVKQYITADDSLIVHRQLSKF